MSKLPFRAALAAVVLAAATAPSAAAVRPVALVPHPHYVEAPDEIVLRKVRRAFYPEGESGSKWTERVLITKRDIVAGTGAPQVLDAMAAEQRSSCPEYVEHRYDVVPADAAILALTMWHCPRNAQGRGEVGIHKVLIVRGAAYVLSVQGDYAAFNAKATPVTREQVDRWSTVAHGFMTCDIWTNVGCFPDANALMTEKEMPPSPGAETAAVRAAETRGAEIYLQERLAELASAYVLSQKLIEKQRASIEYIAIPGPDGSGVVYFVRATNRPKFLLAVAIDAKGNASKLDVDEWSDEAERRYKALRKALSTAFYPTCAETLNTVVMPAEDDDGWWVYLLSTTSDPGIAYLGGHTRIRVDRKARKVLSAEPSAMTCFALDLNATEQVVVGDGAKRVGDVATHLVSDVPWETHVFQSIVYDRPLIVVTSHAAWKVSRGFVIKLAVE